MAGLELLRQGAVGASGLPLASLPSELTSALVGYDALVFAGWDLCASNLAVAARSHAVLDPTQLAAVERALEPLTPWPALGDEAFCRNVAGSHRLAAKSRRDAIHLLRADLRRFRETASLDALVVVNLASTERHVDPATPAFASLAALERALDEDDASIGPAVLYAYAALSESVPYANFTPNVCVEVPALRELAAERKVPVAGKDGKTGQTFLKTVLAPALRARALRVEGWFSTNLLGNRDGLALDDPASRAAKIETKGTVLDQMLGYSVPDHVVDIQYYRPRGDNKEAWDNIDVVGFLDQRMQVKVNFLCRDSILAAPLVIELARLLDLAARRGASGAQEQLSVFFKRPMGTEPDRTPEHAFAEQQRRLLEWLASDSPHR
ncbi:MAG: inositol-3-phosphate synthase [Polyangiaceae bacterium]